MLFDRLREGTNGTFDSSSTELDSSCHAGVLRDSPDDIAFWQTRKPVWTLLLLVSMRSCLVAEHDWQEVKPKRSSQKLVPNSEPKNLSEPYSGMSASDLEDYCSCPITQASQMRFNVHTECLPFPIELTVKS